MPENKNITFSDDEALSYIQSLENPHRVGWDGKVWHTPKQKGYDKNLIAYGLDIREEHNPIVYNFLKSKGRLNDPWLTDAEAKKLTALTFALKKGAMTKAIEIARGNVSQMGYNRLAGMAWHGHPMKMLLDKDSITGKAFRKEIADGNVDLVNTFDTYYGYGSNATLFADRIKQDYNYRPQYVIDKGDYYKKMIINPAVYQNTNDYVSTWNPEQPVKTIYPLNNKAPKSISSWSGANAPNATPRLKDFLEVRQEDLNRGVNVYGDPLSPFSLHLSLPKLGDLLALNTPLRLQLEYFADALGLSDIQPETPSLFPRLKNGKLPKYARGKTVIGSNVQMNDDNTFTDDYTRAFDDLTITPNGPRVKQGQLYKYLEPWDDEKFLNAVTVGGLNNLSPALWLRRGYDLATGNLTTDSWLNGNAGIVPNRYATEHPLMAVAANGLFDFWTLGGPSLLKHARDIELNDLLRQTKYISKKRYIPQKDTDADEWFKIMYPETHSEIPENPPISNNSMIADLKKQYANIDIPELDAGITDLGYDSPIDLKIGLYQKPQLLLRNNNTPVIEHGHFDKVNHKYIPSKLDGYTWDEIHNMSPKEKASFFFDKKYNNDYDIYYYTPKEKHKAYITERDDHKGWYAFKNPDFYSVLNNLYGDDFDLPIILNESDLDLIVGKTSIPFDGEILPPNSPNELLNWNNYRKAIFDKIKLDWDNGGPLSSHLKRSGIEDPSIIMNYILSPELAWYLSFNNPGLDISGHIFKSSVIDDIMRDKNFRKAYYSILKERLKEGGLPNEWADPFFDAFDQTTSFMTNPGRIDIIKKNINSDDKTASDLYYSVFDEVLKNKKIAARKFFNLVDKSYNNAFASRSKGNIYIPLSTENYTDVVSHEFGHLEDVFNFLTTKANSVKGSKQVALSPRADTKLFKKAFNTSDSYFTLGGNDATEMAERATLLKDFFRLEPGQKLTRDQLLYAIQNYSNITGMRNNMKEFFNSIIDIDAALEWINAHGKAIGTTVVAGSTTLGSKLKPRKTKIDTTE